MTADSHQRPPDDLSEREMGPPIGELADLREAPTVGFFARIRSGIERRRLGSDLTELGWKGVFLVVLEFVEMTLQFVAGSGGRDKRR